MDTSDHRPVGLIYTGGTFGMARSASGYVPSTDLPARVERDIPELRAAGMPPIEWLEHAGGPPVNSCDITPPFWYGLADTIRAHGDRCRGFVIIHGTDTLAFTGSALSFLLPERETPVIVTGASRPLGETGSDAGANLRDALRVLATDINREVGVVFGGRLLRANRTTKRHGGPGEPFTSPGCAPLARLEEGPRGGDDSLPELPPPGRRASRYDPVNTRVALVPAYPGLDAATVRALVATGVQGIVLEAYPAGVGPGGDQAFVAAVAEATASGIVVGAVSQAPAGRVQLGRYATSTPLAQAGLVGGQDMTREAALTKLHVLLAGGADPSGARAAFGRNLQGELVER